MQKLLNDIRVYESKELTDLLDATERKSTTKVIPSISAEAKYLPRRIALKLRSLGFKVESGDHFFLYLTPSLGHGEVVPDSTEPHCRAFKCGVAPTRFWQLSKAAREEYFIDAIFVMMKIAADREKLDVGILQSVRSQAIEFGEGLQIVLGENANSFYECRVTFTWAEFSTLFCSVLVIGSGEEANLKLLDLEQASDAFEMVGRISVRKDSLCIFPKKNEVGRCTLIRYAIKLKELGFLSTDARFIQIPISRILVS